MQAERFEGVVEENEELHAAVVESIESVEPVKEAPETSSGRIQAMMRGRAVRQEVSLLRPCCGLCCI